MSTLDNGWNDASPRCWCGGYLRDHWRGRECLRPLGGAHPDAWRQAEQPQDERLYVADGVAILARDPEEAERSIAETLRQYGYSPRSEERKRAAMDRETMP